MSFSSRYRAFFLFFSILPLTGCLFRTRVVERPISTAPLKSTDQAELLNYINSQGAKIQSMQATVDIDTSVGGEKKGKITDYQQIRGYVLVRKPAMLRMIGLLPIVRSRAFDMVSDGHDFKLSIPPKNRFVIGRNDIETHNTQQPLENLRPQIIYNSLLLQPIDPQNEIAVLENDTERVSDAKGHWFEQADYVVDVVRKQAAGWFLSRKIVFSRTDLLPDLQLTYDESGDVATETRYQKYQDYDGQKFPSIVQIKRPQEEYNITLSIVKLQLNEPLPDDKFVLQQPAGAEVVHLDGPQSSSAAGPRMQAGSNQ
jgi:outer membrane lipoprotein-sorting protein